MSDTLALEGDDGIKLVCRGEGRIDALLLLILLLFLLLVLILIPIGVVMICRLLVLLPLNIIDIGMATDS